MGKRQQDNLKLLEEEKKYAFGEAFDLVEKFKAPKFDETVNVAFRLGIDPRQADQQVRGATLLPNGTGKKVKILVFAKGDKAKEAEEAGADYVGGDEFIEKIQKESWMDFDKVIASPDMMAVVSKVARVLGPRGLMPNPKTGTVTPNLAKAIEQERKGKIEFRAEKSGIVHAVIGKKSFGATRLKENFLALLEALLKLKPSTSKGAYIRSATVAPAMSPGVSLDAAQLSSGAVLREEGN